jgi:hypothetical protein
VCSSDLVPPSEIEVRGELEKRHDDGDVEEAVAGA